MCVITPFDTNWIEATDIFDVQGQGPYAKQLRDVEKDIKDIQKRINEKLGVLKVVTYYFNSLFTIH